MSTGIFIPPAAYNEPVRSYAPGTPERTSLQAELARMTAAAPYEVGNWIGGKLVTTGKTFDAVAPHRHVLKLATVHASGRQEVTKAIESCLGVARDWASLPFEMRAGIFLRMADLVSGPWRDRINASTMLNQSKNVQQAEIDAACELADFLRFNVAFASEIFSEQPPVNPNGQWNRLDWRPLEGFVLALSPFNFTAIAGNLPTAPALMGNVVVWKPSDKQAFSADILMQIFREAGLPDGVINLVHGDGAQAVDVATDHPAFAGIHFTGSADVFQSIWGTIGSRVPKLRTFPRIVGETGGKDFLVAHPSADSAKISTALVRAAFEYQGQKCSAASRAYLPKSLWDNGLRDLLADQTASLDMGDVADFSNFMGAVIDRRSYMRLTEAQQQAHTGTDTEVLVGGGAAEGMGWFVEPTIVVTDDPRHDLMQRELFGPLLTIYVYDDTKFSREKWTTVLDQVDQTSPFALTGAVMSADREALHVATERLRNAAGNFYLNDRPTGSVVGQQPFGGARLSGTNDKAGSKLNLLRWTSARSIKETFDAPTDHRYPHMG